MKRILSLDGGGIRGVFTLEVLKRIECLLREHRNKPSLVLADEFDCFAGTSTGAIIAACLCWGMSVDAVVVAGATVVVAAAVVAVAAVVVEPVLLLEHAAAPMAIRVTAARRWRRMGFLLATG